MKFIEWLYSNEWPKWDWTLDVTDTIERSKINLKEPLQPQFIEAKLPWLFFEDLGKCVADFHEEMDFDLDDDPRITTDLNNLALYGLEFAPGINFKKYSVTTSSFTKDENDSIIKSETMIAAVF